MQLKLQQKEFWKELKVYMTQKGTSLPLRKPQPRHWFEISIGRSDFHISLTINSRLNRIGCELLMSGRKGKQAFGLLSEKKKDIEEEIGHYLDWQPLEGKNRSKIIIYKEDVPFLGQGRESAKEWLYSMSERFNSVFSPKVKALKFTTEADLIR